MKIKIEKAKVYVAKSIIVDEKTKTLSAINMFNEIRSTIKPAQYGFMLAVELFLRSAQSKDREEKFELELFSEPDDAITKVTVRGEMKFQTSKRISRLIVDIPALETRSNCDVKMRFVTDSGFKYEEELFKWVFQTG